MRGQVVTGSLADLGLLLLLPITRCSFACSYLVDPASSHMLVSKIKPCMSKHKLLHSEAANGSLGHP